jgi:hypothetical protein
MGRVGGELHAFFNLLLYVGVLPLSDPNRFNSRESITWFPVNGILTLLGRSGKERNIVPQSEIGGVFLSC